MPTTGRKSRWSVGSKAKLGAGAAAVAVAGGTIALVLIGRGGASSKASSYTAAGRALGEGLKATVQKVNELRAPHRCAELVPSTASGSVRAGGREYRRAGRLLRAQPAARGGNRLVLGVVADARGASKATLTQLEAVRAAFEKRNVELVLSLGGMGTHRAELAPVIERLTNPKKWLTVAIPGSRESIAGHRKATSGDTVVDGSVIRMIEIDGVAIATYPGVEHATRLLAAAGGCVHEAIDGNALAVELAKRKGVKVWAAHAPPRQRGRRASDRGAGNVHAGERSMTEAVARSKARLVLHGQIDEAAMGARRGRHRINQGWRRKPQAGGASPRSAIDQGWRRKPQAGGASPRSAIAGVLVLGAGAVEAMPVIQGRERIAGAALVVTIQGGRIDWERIRF